MWLKPAAVWQQYALIGLLLLLLLFLDTAGAITSTHRFLATVNATSPPPQCLVSSSSSTSSSSLSQHICSQRTGRRNATMRSERLAFCDTFLVYNAVGSECAAALSSSQAQCTQCFRRLEQLDNEAHEKFCQFERLISHFDCVTPFSTHGSCHDCQVSSKTGYPLLW